jgi:hypothetical protein
VNLNDLFLSAVVDDSVVLVRCGVHWGSGVVVDSRDGIILTCSHVVRNVSMFSSSTEFCLHYRIVKVYVYSLTLRNTVRIQHRVLFIVCLLLRIYTRPAA